MKILGTMRGTKSFGVGIDGVMSTRLGIGETFPHSIPRVFYYNPRNYSQFIHSLSERQKTVLLARFFVLFQ